MKKLLRECLRRKTTTAKLDTLFSEHFDEFIVLSLDGVVEMIQKHSPGICEYTISNMSLDGVVGGHAGVSLSIDKLDSSLPYRGIFISTYDDIKSVDLALLIAWTRAMIKLEK